ncbi:MAG: Rieske 2Fe-2S domain-containing protein [Verrucomicrobia bacterium]|nr:Rieske 2Fe-2S domain-containing protein [Verrucomicrobiota bacterium]
MPESCRLGRRRFVARFFTGIAACAVAGRAWKLPFVSEVRAADEPSDGVLRISLDDFPALDSVQSSVRLGINPVGDDSFPMGSHYPVLITRDILGRFRALNAECRHASCVVDPYDDFEQGLYCPCHHSLYGMDGSVLRGPATRPLRSHVLRVVNERTLEIRIPGLAFEVQPGVAPVRAGTRLRLTFRSEAMAVYSVEHRPRLDAAWQTAAIAVEENGPPNLTSVLGVDGPMTVFVDRVGDAGFFRVVAEFGEV